MHRSLIVLIHLAYLIPTRLNQRDNEYTMGGSVLSLMWFKCLPTLLHSRILCEYNLFSFVLYNDSLEVNFARKLLMY